MPGDQTTNTKKPSATLRPARSKFIDLPGASCTSQQPDIQAFNGNSDPAEPSALARTATAMAALKSGKKR